MKIIDAVLFALAALFLVVALLAFTTTFSGTVIESTPVPAPAAPPDAIGFT